MISAADILKVPILIVDDLEDNVSMLANMLRRAGYISIASTTNPREVCELHRLNRYGLILLDLQMPVMDGFQVMENLKEIEAGGYLPVLVITAQADQKLRALEAGARDFISKPLDLAELLMRVRNLIEVRLLHVETTRLYAQVMAEQKVSEQLLAVFRSGPVAWSICTVADGRIIDANDEHGRFFGYSRAEILGGGTADPQLWAKPEDRACVMERLLTERTMRGIAISQRRRSGEEREVLASFELIAAAGESEAAYIAMFIDVTERKQAEAQLNELNTQLLIFSRQAGMAEIATNVLHNVGNVLNSVNVSASLIVDAVKKSRASSLGRVVSLLQEHSQDLGAFIASDPKGRQVPAFLAQLSEQLLAEQAETVKELDSLGRNVGHIKEIVAMQQNYATFGGVKEIFNVIELVEDSLRMNEDALQRHHVTVIREFEPLPPINADKHKILQILVNLLRNAIHACEDAGRADGTVTVRVAGRQDRIQLSVMDNGVGIPAANLARIFNHGFTTRKDGHGFGLHSGALAAREMGGSLSVHSDGQGRGANFTLELPRTANEDSHA